MDNLLVDIKNAFRALARHPVFAIGTAVTLAIGVAANTSLFALVNAVAFRPLPVRSPSELVYVNIQGHFRTDRTPQQWVGVSYRDYARIAGFEDLFSSGAFYRSDSARLNADGHKQLARGEAVSDNYFDVLGVVPLIGRHFSQSDISSGAEPVIVISQQLWIEAFHSDPKILGQRVSLDDATTLAPGRAYTIVGVVPLVFHGLVDTWRTSVYWVPISQRLLDRATFCLPPTTNVTRGSVIARRLAGVTHTQATNLLTMRSAELLDQPVDAESWALVTRRSTPISPLPFAGGENIRPERLVVVMFTVSALLLVIVIANLGGMIAARSLSRSGEFALRLTLGATPLRVMRQLAAEGILLAAAGGVAGQWLTNTFLGLLFATMPTAYRNDLVNISIVSLDWRVWGFNATVCVAAGLFMVSGAIRQAHRANPLGRVAGHVVRGSPKLLYFILVPQIAVSIALLVVSVQLISNIQSMGIVYSQYYADPAAPVFVQFALPGLSRCDPLDRSDTLRVARRDFEQRLLSSAVSDFGTREVAIAEQLPFDNRQMAPVITRVGFAHGATSHWVSAQNVSPGYFATLNIPLLLGRDFSDTDGANNQRVAIVSESLARLVAGEIDQSVIGSYIAIYSSTREYQPSWALVIGIVGDVNPSLTEIRAQPSTIYSPLQQRGVGHFAFLTRPGPIGAALEQLKRFVAGASATAEVYRGGSVTDAINQILYPRKLLTIITTVAGVMGILLSCLGLYGVVSYVVSQRVREIGVRVALGATRAHISRLVLLDSFKAITIGSTTGLLVAFGIMRVFSATFVALDSLDISTSIAVVMAISAIVLVSAYWPSQTAASLSPMAALREP